MFRTAETHKRHDYNSCHVQSHSFATEQWQSAVNQVQSPQRGVRTNHRSVPNQCSNVRSFSGSSLSAHAKFDRPRHPKPRVLAMRGFYFRSARTVIVTHRSANEKESASRLGSLGLPDLIFDAKFHKFDFSRDSWRQNNCLFFLNIWLFWRQLAHAIRLVSSLF